VSSVLCQKKPGGYELVGLGSGKVRKFRENTTLGGGNFANVKQTTGENETALKVYKKISKNQILENQIPPESEIFPVSEEERNKNVANLKRNKNLAEKNYEVMRTLATEEEKKKIKLFFIPLVHSVPQTTFNFQIPLTR
jgi:hypothetical protein